MNFKKLIEMAQIITTNNKRYEDLRVFVTPRDIRNNFIFNRNYINGLELPSKVVSNLQENDIILCKLENIDDIVLIDKNSKDYVFSNDFVIIRPKPEYVDYLYIFFLSDYFKSRKRELLSGINKKILRVDTIENLDVLIINHNEDIAEIKSILSSYYNNLVKILTLTTKNKNKLDNIYNYYILGKNKPNKEKQDNLEIEVPENWEVKKVNQVVERMIEGQKKVLRCTKSGVPIIFDYNIYDNSINLINVKCINEKDSKYLNSGFSPNSGDILISKKNGLCYQVTDFLDFNIYEGVICIRPDCSKVNVDFLFILINSSYIREFFINKRKVMDISVIEHIPIVIPPLEEQIEIVNILNDYALKNENINAKAIKKTKEMEEFLYNKINNLFEINIE